VVLSVSGALVCFVLIAFVVPAVSGERVDAAWMTISAVVSVVGILVGTYLDIKLSRRKRYRPWLPIRRSIHHFLIAAIVGTVAVVVAQPWEPPPAGWPWWRTVAFAGFCFFGMWGALALGDWAHRKVQEKKEGQPGNDSR
jgi:hypothetical protein